MTFGEWIRAKRREKHYSSSECAERAGMKVSLWSRWENDGKQQNSAEIVQPRRETVLKIAEGLNVSSDEALQAAGYAPERSEHEELQRISQNLPGGVTLLREGTATHYNSNNETVEVPIDWLKSLNASIMAMQQKLDNVEAKLEEKSTKESR